MTFKRALGSLSIIRVLSLVILFVSLGFCTPIVDKVPDSACILPGISCDPSGQACCSGYQCIQTSASEKAYCVRAERPPFIMARSGFFSGPPPQFIGMDTMPSDVLPRDANVEEETCKQFTHCNLSAPECCGDLICRGTKTEDTYCVVKPKPEEYGTKKNCRINGDDGCISPEDCCEGYYCQKYPTNTHHTPRCLPVDLPPRTWFARSVYLREGVTCQSSLDCQPGGENIACQSYLDCPDDYRCFHDKEGTRDGTCMAPGEHHGWLINRRDPKMVQKAKEKEFEFPEFPTSWCTQEGCPCYISSPCEMGICDNFDERIIGRCRKFRPGEGDDLQPGFPIDTV
ncbi:hypothetical protein BGX38DRAFT_1328341, partial [Terfezia claveryi]